MARYRGHGHFLHLQFRRRHRLLLALSRRIEDYQSETQPRGAETEKSFCREKTGEGVRDRLIVGRFVARFVW